MKRTLIILGLAIIILVIALLGWYLLSPLFIDVAVNETLSEDLGSSTDLEYSYVGSFTDADSFHKVSGDALIFDLDGKKYLRLQNFAATNGPDLKVYLATDLEAKDYVSLGDLKGNIGDQNYELSNEVDLMKYDQVLIWCERFSVLFGSAQLKSF